MSKAQNGNKITLHYAGVLNNGTEFDNSKTRGQPMEFTIGSGQVISGFNDAVIGMESGETKTFNISAENAYGQVNENAINTFPKNSFPEDFEFTVGMPVQGNDQNGTPFQARITGIGDDNVTVDFNHPLAGEDLNFTVEILNIEEQ